MINETESVTKKVSHQRTLQRQMLHSWIPPSISNMSYYHFLIVRRILKTTRAILPYHQNQRMTQDTGQEVSVIIITTKFSIKSQQIKYNSMLVNVSR